MTTYLPYYHDYSSVLNIDHLSTLLSAEAKISNRIRHCRYCCIQGMTERDYDQLLLSLSRKDVSYFITETLFQGSITYRVMLFFHANDFDIFTDIGVNWDNSSFIVDQIETYSPIDIRYSKQKEDLLATMSAYPIGQTDIKEPVIKLSL